MAECTVEAESFFGPILFVVDLPVDFVEGVNTGPADRQLDLLGHFTLSQVKILRSCLDPTLNPL